MKPRGAFFVFATASRDMSHYAWGRALVLLDITWLIVWFAFSVWFIADTTIENTYRDNLRNLLFHVTNTGGVLSILRFGTGRWGAGFPFLFAILADVEIGVTMIVNLPNTHAAARIASITWAWTGVALTLCGIMWFFSAPLGKQKAPANTYERF
jgi:hypothetical protein